MVETLWINLLSKMLENLMNFNCNLNLNLPGIKKNKALNVILLMHLSGILMNIWEMDQD